MRRFLSVVTGALIMTVGTAVAAPAHAAVAPPPPDEETAAVETDPRFDDPAGGFAATDDPAIWVHPSRPQDSVVLGTLKHGGLDVYDLKGHVLQHIRAPEPPDEGLEPGDFNNVDLVQGVDVAGLPTDFAVVSDRGRDRLRIYAIDPAGAGAGDDVLTDITDPDAPLVFSVDEDAVEEELNAYGLTLAVRADGSVQAIVSQRNTTFLRMFELRAGTGGTVSYELLDEVRLPTKFRLPNGTVWHPCTEPGEGPKFEGMVVDPRTQLLYAAQEEVGIWAMPLGSDEFQGRHLIERVIEYGTEGEWDEDLERCELVGEDPGYGGQHLSAQVEGLSIAYQKTGTSTMVVSSQGDSSFGQFRLGRDGSRWRWFRQFEVVTSESIDKVTNCDGAAVVAASLGPDFPGGLLVVQDGQNNGTMIDTDPGLDSVEGRNKTNFKFLRWDEARR